MSEPPRTAADRPSAVIFGAGAVGRGFIGQLLSESGYAIVFVDVDQPLIEALNRRGCYPLRLAGLTRAEELTIGPVRAVSAGDRQAVAEAVAGASLAATSVGARELASLAAALAAGLVRRWEAGRTDPLNIILCENLHGAPDLLREAVSGALPAPWREPLRARVGFVAAVIARMAPVPTEEQRAADPARAVAEPYKVLPVDREALVGPVPRIVGMKAVAPFEAYAARKLFIHNAAHAILGYLGYARGHVYGWEALEDAWVRERVEAAADEAGRALIAEYGFEPVAFQEHIDGLMMRFANRALGDPVIRLGRDPLRKLAPGERLVGAARLAEKHGIAPEGLACGIAGALTFDESSDPHALELQARIRAGGLDAVLREVCALGPEEPLACRVRQSARARPTA